MPNFSESSKGKLYTCHTELQLVCFEAIKYIDFTVICGARPIEEQFKLFKQGRDKLDDTWIIRDRTKVVTNCDGKIKKSAHNKKISDAVDIAPSPIKWNDPDPRVRLEYEKQQYKLGGLILGIASQLDIELQWGGDWKSIEDLPHFQRG